MIVPPIFELVTAWAVTSVLFYDGGVKCTGVVPKVVGFIVVFR